MNLRLLLIQFALNSFAQALSTCWYPDGITVENGHVPCNQTTNSPSACCAPQDGCSSGLCVSIFGTYRGSCTDQSWNSPNCGAWQWSQCIIDPTTRRRYNRATPLLTCANPGTEVANFCCGTGNGSTCCNDQFRLSNNGPVFSPGLDIIVANSGALATSNTTNITNVPASGQDLGAKIGLGIGIPLSVIAISIMGLLFYREHNKSVMQDLNTASVGLVSNVNQHPPMDQPNLYANYSNIQSYPPTASTPHQSYSPPSPKPDPVYEAPVSNVHEMRG